MKAKHCDECQYFNEAYLSGGTVCSKGHNPQWCEPMPNSRYTIDYGFKRQCDDFEEWKGPNNG